jgi:peptide/nickel transport system permease protein
MKENMRSQTALDRWKTEHRAQIDEFSFIIGTLMRNPLSVLGLLIVTGIVVMALASFVIQPLAVWETSNLEQKLLPPTLQHLFGTDDMGRDILRRVLSGSRISIEIGVVVVTIAIGIGVPLGLVAGFLGGKVDEIIMRTTDMFLSFPPLLLALFIAAALGPSITNAMAAISITWWPWYTRLVRSQTLSLKEEAFVEAARSLGAGNARIAFLHILPNCWAPIIVQASLDVGYAILTAAALGFIGVGAQAPAPEWGLMISQGRIYLPRYWWPSTFPGLAILVAVLGFNLLGDALRDLLDPRLRRLYWS